MNIEDKYTLVISIATADRLHPDNILHELKQAGAISAEEIQKIKSLLLERQSEHPWIVSAPPHTQVELEKCTAQAIQKNR